MMITCYSFIRTFFVLALSVIMVACSSNPAPVIDRLPAGKSSSASKPNSVTKSTKQSSSMMANGDWRPDSYIVKKGDTLFSIGLEHGYDYKDVAQANNIEAPYMIKIGQVLKFTALKEKVASTETKPAQENSDGVVTYAINTESIATSITAAPATPLILALSEPKAMREPYSDEAFKRPLPIAKPATTANNTVKPALDKQTQDKPVIDKQTTDKQLIDKQTIDKPSVEVKPTEAKAEPKLTVESSGNLNWAWPTKGKIIASFNEAGNKGVDIAGSMGQSIQAAAAGKVIYSGSDLRGYGKLVIVKHNATYLSVYANNSLILVKEGQQVSRGQKIAEMGDSDSNMVKLHFEIRQQGKSVDPIKFLAAN